jgi:hypothetical protein
MNTQQDSNNELIAEKQSSQWNYAVEKIALHTPEGNSSGFFATRRTDTQECLGAISNRYGIVQNSELFGQAEDIFNGLNLGERKTKFVVTHNGSRAHAIYDFRNLGIVVGGKDNLILRLKVQNSFDGSLGASFSVGLFRLICSNGMAAPFGNTVNISKKHTQGISTGFFQAAVERSVERFTEVVPVFNRMANTSITQGQGVNALVNMAKAKTISDRMAEQIAGVWNAPRYTEDSDRTVYNLYNAATQHLTHEVSTKRFDLAERATAGILKTLVSSGLDAKSGLYLSNPVLN